MTKAKTNALEALRALIAERQQYEQWISALESKREGTPAHVFDRVSGDYNTRLQRVVSDIRGHAEELQLSISTLSSRLVEVAREEDMRRDALQEAELRAEVGEFEPKQWEQLKAEAERNLEKIASDRTSLDSQLAELRSIQKLSEVGSVGDVGNVAVAAPATEPDESYVSLAASGPTAASAHSEPAVMPEATLEAATQPSYAIADRSGEIAAAAPVAPANSSEPVAGSMVEPVAVEREQAAMPIDHQRQPVVAASPPTPRPRTGKTPPFGSTPPRPKAAEARVDQSKTLKCPECGTPNYPTEWYCERCGGELATM